MLHPPLGNKQQIAYEPGNQRQNNRVDRRFLSLRDFGVQAISERLTVGSKEL